MLSIATTDQPSATFGILAFTGTMLGKRYEERKILLVWARAITEGEIDGSVAQFCAPTGLQRRSFDRRRLCAYEDRGREEPRRRARP